MDLSEIDWSGGMITCCKKGEKVSTPLDKDGQHIYSHGTVALRHHDKFLLPYYLTTLNKIFVSITSIVTSYYLPYLLCRCDVSLRSPQRVQVRFPVECRAFVLLPSGGVCV